MIGFPFDSHIEYDELGYPIYDRAISSAPYRELLHKLFNDGVMPNPSTNMQVTAGQGLKVKVASGFAMVRGCMKLAENDETLSLSTADRVNKRIDTIVLRLNTNDSVRSLEYAVITGTPASNPVAPPLVRTASIYDIGLANVLVNVNAVSLSNANITDTRYNSERCGILSSISKFDTTTLYNQIQTDLKEFKKDYEEDMETWTEQQKADFEEWFKKIQDILDESVAGKLQDEINLLDNRLQNEINLLNSRVETNENTKANKNDVYGTDEKYSSTKTYSVGNMVIYNNKLWSCILACSGKTPTEGSNYWESISLSRLNNKLIIKDINVSNGKYCSSKTIQAKQEGNKVTISSEIVTTAIGSTVYEAELLNQLPPPKSVVFLPLLESGGSVYRGIVRTDGKLYTYYTGKSHPANSRFLVSFSYYID